MYKSYIRRGNTSIIKWTVVIKLRYIDAIFVKLDGHKIVQKNFVLKKKEKRKEYRININIRDIYESRIRNNTIDI